jgi:hypothetical protein
MIPLPDKPVIVIHIDVHGEVKFATNVSPDLIVKVEATNPSFEAAKQGLPFEGQTI